MDLHLSISNGFVSSKIYDKLGDFDFDIVNFPFLDGDVPCYEMDKNTFPCSKFLRPGVSFGPIQHLRGLNSIKLGYLNFTARLT